LREGETKNKTKQNKKTVKGTNQKMFALRIRTSKEEIKKTQNHTMEKKMKHKVCTYITIKRHLNPAAHSSLATLRVRREWAPYRTREGACRPHYNSKQTHIKNQKVVPPQFRFDRLKKRGAFETQERGEWLPHSSAAGKKLHITMSKRRSSSIPLMSCCETYFQASHMFFSFIWKRIQNKE